MTPRALVIVALLALTAGCSVVRIGGDGRVDVNGADVGTLATLPGIDANAAARIVAHRPYMAKDDLRRSRVLTDDQYAAVADSLFVGPPGMPDYLRWMPPMIGP